MSLLLLLLGAGEAPPAPVIDKVFGRAGAQSAQRGDVRAQSAQRGEVGAEGRRRGEVDTGREPA